MVFLKVSEGGVGILTRKYRSIERKYQENEKTCITRRFRICRPGLPSAKYYCENQINVGEKDGTQDRYRRNKETTWKILT
jgi:t-SNARE complex subunit (syntaxin)